MTLSQSIIWIDNLMNNLLLRLKRNLLKIIWFYFFFEFSTNHGGISAELIITKNGLLKELPDMTVHREVNVRHKRIIIARKTLILAYFLWNCPKRFLILTNFNLPCIGWCKFLQKMFFRLEGKTLHLVYQIFARWEKKKRKEKEN